MNHRLSNYPNFAWISRILTMLCNPDRKNHDFEICSNILKWIRMILIQEHIPVSGYTWQKRIHQKTLKTDKNKWNRILIQEAPQIKILHKNHNWFRELFRQKLCSQKTRNGISKDQDFKLFWGRIPPDPLAAHPFGACMKKINILILPTHKVGQSEINIYLLTHKTQLEKVSFINYF